MPGNPKYMNNLKSLNNNYIIITLFNLCFKYISEVFFSIYCIYYYGETPCTLHVPNSPPPQKTTASPPTLSTTKIGYLLEYLVKKGNHEIYLNP